MRSLLPPAMLLLACAPAAAQPIVAGRWNVASTAVELVVPGAPGFMLRMARGRTQTKAQCLTPVQAHAGIESLLVAKPEAGCTVERAVVTDGRIDHAMLCPQKTGTPMRVVRVGRYTPAGFTLRMTVSGTTPKGPLRIVADQVATHAGPRCP